MRKFFRLSAVLGGIAMFALTGCNKLRSRDQRNQGVHDFTSAKYADAIEHFTKAVELDPDDPVNRSYLATSYFAQWIPGAESPQNLEFASRAREEFKKVLAQDPKDLNALQYLSSMAYSEAQPLPLEKKGEKYDEAVEWNRKVIEVDPNNKQAFYFLGVIAYYKWHPALVLAEQELKMKSDDPGPFKDKKVKEKLKQEYGAALDEGIADLQKAETIDKDYADAMAFRQLMIREKAYLADDRAGYDQELAKANDLLQKTIDTKKRINDAKAANTSPGGIVEDAPKN
jgi:tetratricopeptide (TPR) repeat protein